MAVVEQSLAERIDVVLEDYVVDLGSRYRGFHGDGRDALHRQNCRTTWPGFASAWVVSDTRRSAP